MAALGLSHTTSVAWAHIYIYTVTYSHMFPLAPLMHTHDTHASPTLYTLIY